MLSKEELGKLIAKEGIVMMPKQLDAMMIYLIACTKHQQQKEEAEKLIADAKLLEEAGCFAIVLEKIPAKLATQVAQSIAIPVIGIGAGSSCTTRIVAGVGVPQLASVMDVCEVSSKKGISIISDGGITCPGDMCKAYGGGSDFVMVGGQFAGHDENPGKIRHRTCM